VNLVKTRFHKFLYSCGKLYENVVEKNFAGLLSNTRFLNESKRLAFLWRWLCGWKLFLEINASKRLIYKKQSSA